MCTDSIASISTTRIMAVALETILQFSAEAREVVAAASALRTVAERCQAAVEAPNLALRDHITLPDASDDSR